ncbi:hypothetical protein E2C01_054141 [Portunus trituberculatus]|uniref:Uncharacterized protein n=1 Tax=Portunus trituberculatus TaxID=210409 RepID=A0A5B7GU75_PORTR|nr:hypothetical protein [Portunus trituberculatus]
MWNIPPGSEVVWGSLGYTSNFRKEASLKKMEKKTKGWRGKVEILNMVMRMDIIDQILPINEFSANQKFTSLELGVITGGQHQPNNIQQIFQCLYRFIKDVANREGVQ